MKDDSNVMFLFLPPASNQICIIFTLFANRCRGTPYKKSERIEIGMNSFLDMCHFQNSSIQLEVHFNHSKAYQYDKLCNGNRHVVA